MTASSAAKQSIQCIRPLLYKLQETGQKTKFFEMIRFGEWLSKNRLLLLLTVSQDDSP